MENIQDNPEKQDIYVNRSDNGPTITVTRTLPEIQERFINKSSEGVEAVARRGIRPIVYEEHNRNKLYEGLGNFVKRDERTGNFGRRVTILPFSKTSEIRGGEDQDIYVKYYETTNKTKKIGAALSEPEDVRLFCDPSSNSIPATCFEAGAALSILENPGEAGELMDFYAQLLDTVLKKVYGQGDESLGDLKLEYGGEEKTLKDIFNHKLLKEVRPTSDQIGRCTDNTLEEGWFEGEGLEWLSKQLQISSKGSDYSDKNMLTKVRVISAFGTIIRELMATEKADNEEIVAEMIPNRKDINYIKLAYKDIKSYLRHKGFDAFETRSRYERQPVIDGVPASEACGIEVSRLKLENAAHYGLGFGEIYTEKTFENFPEVVEKYKKELEDKGGRQALPRVDQPIKDLNRPGLISEYALTCIPKSFKDKNLLQLLKDKQFNHGVGINRWQVNGTYAKQSHQNGLPAAGSHSGGTVDILLALECLHPIQLINSEDNIYKAGLIIASFMNFGGYHSFNETFPIANAYAKGKKFLVDASGRPAKTLYEAFNAAAKLYLPSETSKKVSGFLDAYYDSFHDEDLIKKLKRRNLFNEGA